MLIDGYLNHLLVQRKLSPHTINSYACDLLELSDFANSTSISIDALTHTDIRKFASKLYAQGLKARSIGRKLSAWRGFFHYLSEQNLVASNPVHGIKAPKSARTLPKALSVDDAIRLVATQNPKSADKLAKKAMHLCNQAMFELLYSSGLRVSELVSLDVRYIKEAGYVSQGWIDCAACEVVVTGKGNKMRSVPLGQAALTAIQAWLAVRIPTIKSGSDTTHAKFALFLSERGSRMSSRVVQLRLKTHAQALGIPANVHPHVLRHCFASHLLQSSGDLRAVQELLGHSAITSTQIYTSLDFMRLSKVYDAAHPRAKRK